MNRQKEPQVSETADPRPQLHAALDQASRVIAGVKPDQLGNPTPCDEFDVRALAGHLVGVARRVAGVGRGEPQNGEVDVSGLTGDGFTKAFDDARHQALGGWADGAVLAREVALPFATLPGAMVAGVYTLELTAHTWDLASATGQLEGLDPALADAALTVASAVLPPEPRGGEIPFAAVVDVPADAPPYDRLAGYLGRRPA
jgi:uncharacterized protein (TIGR03086 family)